MSHEQELQQAVDYIKAGDKQTARQILVGIIKQNPQHEIAWLRLASITGELDKQRQCLNQVLRINPSNEIAQKRIAQLDQRKAQQPPSASSESPVSSPKKITPLNKEIATKECPYCAETIRAEAIVCRFCGRDLRTGELGAQPSVQQPQPPSAVYVINEKNPDMAGCLNIIIPGLGYIYIENWVRALFTFVAGSIIIGFLVALVAFDGGICSVPALIGVVLVLFFEARSAAKKYNRRMKDRVSN